jgi:hypothetical protein
MFSDQPSSEQALSGAWHSSTSRRGPPGIEGLSLIDIYQDCS